MVLKKKTYKFSEFVIYVFKHKIMLYSERIKQENVIILPLSTIYSFKICLGIQLNFFQITK